MAKIIYRGTKPTAQNANDGAVNRPLTNTEIDGNFFTLDADKLDKVTTAAQSVASNVTFSGNVVVSGDLTVSGDTTTLNVATLDVEDKNIVLASGATTDAAANGGGITLKGASNKTFNWVQADTAWTSSENIKLAAGKNVVLSGATSGTVILATPAAAGSTTITFPATNGTVITSGDSGTVATAMIADLNVTEGKLAAGAVVEGKIGAAAVTTAKIADLNVTTAKIADLNVTTAKIADLNVTTAKIADGAATIAKGGVGFTTYTAGDIIYANAANSLAKLAKGTDGQVLKLASGIPSWAADTDTNTTYTLDGSDKLLIGQATIDLVAGGSGSGTDSVTLIGRSGNQYLWSESSQELYVYGGFSPTYVTRSDLTTKTAFAAPGSQGGTITISNITQEDALTLESHLISSTVLFVSGCTGSFVNNNGNYLVNTCVATLNGASSSVVITLSSFIKSVQVTASAGAAGNTPQLMYVRKNEDVNGVRYSKYGGTGYDTYTKGDFLVGLSDGTLGKRGVGSNGQVLKVVNGDPTWSTDSDTTYTASTGLTLTGTAFSVSFGNTSTTACVGNDARLSDARTPLAHNHYIGTTAVQSSSANQNLTGINSILLSGADSYISTPTSSEFSGYGITIQPGSAPNDGAELNLYGGNVTVDNGTGGWVGVAGGRALASTGGTAGGVAIVGGYSNGTSGTKTGGSVYIDGGGASGAGTNNQGNIFIGTRNETQYNTGIITIGRSGNTIRLPAVGTSGFVKLGANGTLSADTNTYLTSYTETDTLTSVTGRGATTNVNITYANNANANFDSITGPLNSATTYTASRILFNGFGVTDATGEYYSILSQTTGNALAAIRMGHASRTGRIEFGNMAYWTGFAQSYGNGTYPIVMRAASSNGASAILEVTSGEIRSPIYYEYGNTAYYLDLGATGTSLNTAGSIIAGGNLTANSDRRLKTDIRVIENALDKVHKITGVTFDRTDNPDVGRQTGVIAQEVKEVLPEAVIGNEESYYSVAYGNMVGLLIEAIKELNAKVEDLQKQLSNK